MRLSAPLAALALSLPAPRAGAVDITKPAAPVVVHPVIALDWAASLDGFLSAPKPDAASLQGLLPALSRLDANDPATREAMKPVAQALRDSASTLLGSELSLKSLARPGTTEPDSPAALKLAVLSHPAVQIWLEKEQRDKVGLVSAYFDEDELRAARQKIEPKIRALAAAWAGATGSAAPAGKAVEAGPAIGLGAPPVAARPPRAAPEGRSLLLATTLHDMTNSASALSHLELAEPKGKDAAFNTLLERMKREASRIHAMLRALTARHRDARGEPNAESGILADMSSGLAPMVNGARALLAELNTVRIFRASDAAFRDPLPASAWASIERALRLTSHMLHELGGPEADAPLNPARLDLAELARETASDLRRTKPAVWRNVTIELSIPESAAFVTADRGLLERLLFNLGSNGIKYNRKDGRLVIGLRPAPGGYEVTFADEGEGIAPEDLARLSTPYFRTDAARRSGVEGTGLGLASVKAAVEKHGGRLSVKSELGQGTTFTVFLPEHPRSSDATALQKK